MDMQGNIWAGSNSFKFVGCDSLLIRNCVFNSNPYNGTNSDYHRCDRYICRGR